MDFCVLLPNGNRSLGIEMVCLLSAGSVCRFTTGGRVCNPPHAASFSHPIAAGCKPALLGCYQSVACILRPMHLKSTVRVQRTNGLGSPTGSCILAQGNALGAGIETIGRLKVCCIKQGLHIGNAWVVVMYEAGLQPANLSSSIHPGRCPGLVYKSPLGFGIL